MWTETIRSLASVNKRFEEVRDGFAKTRPSFAWERTEFQIGVIAMVANTGTYLGSPFHRYADEKDLTNKG